MWLAEDARGGVYLCPVGFGEFADGLATVAVLGQLHKVADGGCAVKADAVVAAETLAPHAA